jgi:hypothetical protein
MEASPAPPPSQIVSADETWLSPAKRTMRIEKHRKIGRFHASDGIDPPINA